jgi:hypothetical protein
MAEQEKSYSDFWLNKDLLNQYIPKGNGSFSMDLIQLAAYRRIVSNFVYILTHLDIPVQFCSEEKSTLSFTDGNMVYLSASIRKKSDFDWSVGVALHEASHILLTDFDVAKSTFSRVPIPIPLSLKKKAKDKNLSEGQIAHLCKWVWNYVEDRYIDSYIFKEAPGYRGYYKAMYEKFWNGEVQSKMLTSDAFRIPNLFSYEVRVINLTNPDTDLDALVGLREIAELIDIQNIFRLKTTVQRMDLSYKVVEIIVDNLGIQKDEPDPNSANATVKTVHDKLSPSNRSGNSNISGSLNNEKNIEEGKVNTKEEKANEHQTEKGNEPVKYDPADAGNITNFSKNELNDLYDKLNQQRKILDHNYEGIKEHVTKQQEAVLDAIEKAGIVLLPAGFGLNLSGDYTQAAVDCIVVKKLTKQLIDSGTETFPLAAIDRSAPGGTSLPPQRYDEAVAKGFVLGKLLGRKLQIRGEEVLTKYIRKHSGKIERRLLADIGVGFEHIFNRTKSEKYNKARLHISVDSSGSMQSDYKWCPTMTCVVAICVAASMVENLEVSVSFRSTICTYSSLGNNAELPYIVLAYDSKTDKISKVRQLFPYLCANGSTPEGLAFEAIAEEFIIGKKTTEQDHYFLNISDGEPCYVIRSHVNRYGVGFNYTGEVGALHTKLQIDKIRSHGVKVLSYFIQEENLRLPIININGNMRGKNRQLTLKELFDLMYGKDAQFIDVESVVEIARTINKLFLSKEV